MFDHLRALAVFANVAEAGSFRAAAKQLGITASVVSHHVTALERHLDTPLIYRTTRKLSLTAEGRDLARSARAMLDAAEEGVGRIGHQGPNPVGSLKITAPAILQHARFVTRVSTFAKHYSKVDVSLTFTDRRLNMVEEGFDLALRVGWLDDSSLMARKLADGHLVLCAAPDYLTANPGIEIPDDLGRLEMINLVGTTTTIELVPMSGGAGRSIPMRHRIRVDSGFTARRMAEEGCGLVVLPDFFVHAALADGRLVEILPGWRAPDYAIYAVWPPNRGTHLLRTQFVDFVAGIARTGPEADRVWRADGDHCD